MIFVYFWGKSFALSFVIRRVKVVIWPSVIQKPVFTFITPIHSFPFFVCCVVYVSTLVEYTTVVNTCRIKKLSEMY